MSRDPVSDLLLLLALVADDRTCLVIGEIVKKDGSRVEVVRIRGESLLTVHTDALKALRECAAAATKHPSMNDPAELVVRVLRPVKE